MGVNQGLSKHQEVSSSPVTKVKKIIVFFGTFLVQYKGKYSNICGSYKLLLSNVAHQTKEKLTIQNKFSHF